MARRCRCRSFRSRGAIVALDINLPVNTNEEESINTSHVRRSMEEKIFLEVFGNTRGPHRRA